MDTCLVQSIELCHCRPDLLSEWMTAKNILAVTINFVGICIKEFPDNILFICLGDDFQ